MHRITLVVAILLLAASAAGAGESPSPPGARVFFVGLKSGDVVASPLTVKFGIAGMALAPAGEEKPNTGHHHLIIDGTISGAALDEPIPADETHLHFGKGQTEATIILPRGRHTLQLVLGDWSHVPHKPPVMSERISILVQ